MKKEMLINALYCPQASYMEPTAQNTTLTPKNCSDSIIDTPENREAGNISYVYWSFLENKPGAGTGTQAYWRNWEFFPRILKTSGMQSRADVKFMNAAQLAAWNKANKDAVSSHVRLLPARRPVPPRARARWRTERRVPRRTRRHGRR